MNLTDRIKGGDFVDEYHKATINVCYTGNWIMNLLEQRTAKFNVTVPQYNVLRILRRQFPTPASNTLIKARMISIMPDISRMIDRMVLKGLVTRTQSAHDRRVSDLLITDQGLRLLEDLDDGLLLSNVISENLSKDEAILLNELLDKMSINNGLS